MMNPRTLKPDDSGVMLLVVVSMLVSRLDAPYAFAGLVLVASAIAYRWLNR